jgi:DNA-binding CsgD family transcriptional regulator
MRIHRRLQPADPGRCPPPPAVLRRAARPSRADPGRCAAGRGPPHPRLPTPPAPPPRTRAAYTADRCRCRPCTEANRRAEADRVKAVAYGRWHPYVDAAAARRHVQQLMAARIGLRRVADLSGVPHGSLTKLLHGDPRTGRPPSRRIRPATEAALLAVTPTVGNVAPGTVIDATGTRRRLQALLTRGWPQAHLAHLLGRRRSNVGRLLQARTVTGRTERDVRALYDRIWHTPPPQRTARERAAADQARALAARHGWQPPLAWDDIDTDPDPATGTCPLPAATATPHPGQPPARHRSPRPRSPAQPAHSAPPAADDDTSYGDWADVDGLDLEDVEDVEDVDDIAVERAMTGDRVALTGAERDEVVRRLTARGLPVRQIAERLHTTPRTVTRLRSSIRAA